MAKPYERPFSVTREMQKPGEEGVVLTGVDGTTRNKNNNVLLKEEFRKERVKQKRSPKEKAR